MVSRDLCPSRRTPEGLKFTHITSTEVRYWHHVLPWCSAFILVCVCVGIVHVVVMWPREGTREVQRHRRMRIRGDIPIKGPPAFTPCPLVRHQKTCSRSPDALAPYRVLTGLKVGKTIPTRALGRPTAREKPVYRAHLMAILTATAQLLAESFRLLPLAGCRTRLLRAWPHAYLWVRRCPSAKHPLGC